MMIVKSTVKESIDSIYILDCMAYPEEMTTKQWYLDRYDGRETVYLFIQDDEVIGYGMVMDIAQEFAKALTDGVLDGDVVVSNNMFKGNGDFFYAGSFVVAEQHRGIGIFSQILDIVMRDFGDKPMYALTNEHTTKAFLAKGFSIVKNNGHYNTVVKY